MPKCKNCGYENKAQAEFCIECGSPLNRNEKTCPHCGMDNRETAIFCIECGKKIEADTAVVSDEAKSDDVVQIDSAYDRSNEETTVEPISKLIREPADETTTEEEPQETEEETTNPEEPQETEEETADNLKVCTKCGHENPEDSSFCNICGNKLDVSGNICPNCGKENPENSSFCNSCGTNLKEEHFIFCQLCGTKNNYSNYRCSGCNQVLLK